MNQNFLTKHISCKCKCKFDKSKCNSNQKRNNDKCRCECKKNQIFEKDFICNPATRSCESVSIFSKYSDDDSMIR